MESIGFRGHDFELIITILSLYILIFIDLLLVIIMYYHYFQIGICIYYVFISNIGIWSKL